ncbi:hypothetical protein JCM11491_000614 [Sporobolomyces phaffii]
MDPSTFESSHVHTVYNAIASDFSRTRHSRWPFVQSFLESLPPGSLVLDAGTGNGKYLGVRSLLEWDDKRDPAPATAATTRGGTAAPADGPPVSDLFNVGFDMSDGLLGIASGKGHEVVRGDCVDMSCWRSGAFDHAISIATIHHFATPERRTESIKQMILSILPPSPPAANASTSRHPRAPGRILIVVWSLEQDPSLLGARSARRTTGGKKGAIEIDVDPLLAQQRRDQGREEVDALTTAATAGTAGTAHEGVKKGKDVFVPWEKQEEVVPRKKKEPTPRRKGPKNPPNEREHAESRPIANPSRDDQPVRPTPTERIADDPAAITAPTPVVPPSPPTPKPTFNRYYHLFAQYELSGLVQDAARALGLEFDCPSDYPLDVDSDTSPSKSSRLGIEEGGWTRYARLVEERWERENWVAEVQVGWRRGTETCVGLAA